MQATESGIDIILLLLLEIGWPKVITLSIVMQAIEYYGRVGVQNQIFFKPDHF